MKRISNTISLYLALCFLAACSQLPSAVLQNESCSPPCWNQIIPGQSSSQDVRKLLTSIPAVNSESIRTISILQPNDGFDFKFHRSLSEDGGRVLSQSGIVELIDFGLKPNAVRLDDIMQKWGSPDEYISLYYWYVEHPYLATSIIYSHKCISHKLSTLTACQGN